MNPLKLNPKRILFIATRQIGDVLVTTPLICRARELWPKAQFDFLGYRGKLDMLKGNPDLHELIETSAHPRLREYFGLFKRLFLRYDLAIITQPSDRAYIFGLIASKHRVGVLSPEIAQMKRQSRWKKSICLHSVTINYFAQHVVVEKLRLLDVFYSNNQPSLSNNAIHVVPPVAEELNPSLRSQLKAPYVVLHITPLTQYKRWPLTHWKVVIIWLVEQGWHVVLSVSSAKQDLDYNHELMSLLDKETLPKVLNTQGQLSITQAVTLLQAAELYIGIDTSITHLAAACGTKTFALFGPTPPTNFGPWPNGFSGSQPYQLKKNRQTVNNVTIIQGVGHCVPCRKAGCEDSAEISRSECLDLLNPLDVIMAIKETF